jgi:hypothetical protein
VADLRTELAALADEWETGPAVGYDRNEQVELDTEKQHARTLRALLDAHAPASKPEGEGWESMGTHAYCNVALEFSENNEETGLPDWERVVFDDDGVPAQVIPASEVASSAALARVEALAKRFDAVVGFRGTAAAVRAALATPTITNEGDDHE